MEYLERLAQKRSEHRAGLSGMCKAKDLKRELTFSWFGIGKVWILNKENIGRN